MIRSLNSGVSGMLQNQRRMDVIGNNIANTNTTGFKAARADFADTFSQTLRAARSNVGAMQVGLGAFTTNIKNLFTQGAFARTDVPEDLAIAGQGFFEVRPPLSGETFVTRAGDFHLNEEGYLLTNTGFHVQGFSDGTLTTRGDIRIDDTGRPASALPDAKFAAYNIDEFGKIWVSLTDGTKFVRGQVLLQRFRDPQMLEKKGDNLFSPTEAAGPLPASAPSGTNGLGQISSGALEISNVDIANEFANLITSQRAFQANARIITTSDEVLAEVINLKR